MKHIYSAGIIVYRINDEKVEYLVLQYAAGHWDFAKGKMESGETKQEAALRELYEETGLSAHIDEHFEETFSYIFRNYDTKLAQKTVYFFIGQQCNNTNVTLSDEHIDYVWLPYKKAIEIITYDNAKKMLKKVNSYITTQYKKN